LADDAELALTWQHLDAVTIGAKLGFGTLAPSPLTLTWQHLNAITSM
jgi:hypothetical protein